jgi:hypothetical protein
MAPGCDAFETTMCSTKKLLRIILDTVNRFGETTSIDGSCGTQIFTFSQHEIAAGVCDEAVTGSVEFGMLVLFTSY